MAILLKNQAARVLLQPEHGGRVSSLCVGGHELLVGEDPDPLLWGCYPMVPWAGRLRHGVLDFRGRRYQLPVTFPPHAIHGTTWDVSWRTAGEHEMVLPLEKPWPFGGRAVHIVQLEDDNLRMRLELHADDESFPASLGWHPWFRRNLDGGAGARLLFDAELCYDLDEECIPTGELSPPGPGPWDDCFTAVQDPPRIAWPGAVEISLHTSVDHWMVYDRPAHAICVEPMSAPPNALNTQPHVVEPGNPLVGEFTIRWNLLR